MGTCSAECDMLMENSSSDNMAKLLNNFCMKLMERDYVKTGQRQFDEFIGKSAKVCFADFVIAHGMCNSYDLRFVHDMDAYAGREGMGNDAILYLKRREFLARGAYLSGTFSEERMLAVLSALESRLENRVKEGGQDEKISRAMAYGLIPSGYTVGPIPELDDNPSDGGPALFGGTA